MGAKAMKHLYFMKGRKFVKKNYGLKVKVGGKNLDKVICDAARLAIKGKGDGKISVADTKMLVKAVRPTKDGRSSYDKLEKDTVAYVRANFTFTPAADKAFRKAIAKLAAGQAKRTKAKKAKKAK